MRLVALPDISGRTVYINREAVETVEVREGFEGQVLVRFVGGHTGYAVLGELADIVNALRDAP
jgi:hypothetical protein